MQLNKLTAMTCRLISLGVLAPVIIIIIIKFFNKKSCQTQLHKR